MKGGPIETLSNELLQIILDHVESDPDKTIPIDKRQFLSVESFHRPPPPQRGSLRDIGNLRRANKRFAVVGEPLLFTRVAGRFSERGLTKLEALAGWPHLARHVKKFTYLVPYFYSDVSSGDRDLRPGTQRSGVRLDLQALQQKVREQQAIRASGRDVEVLKKAIASFTSLQLVQLLRIADDEDEKLLTQIRQHGESTQPFRLEWAPACLHGSRTIGMALLAADVPWSRFSSPMLSPQSAEILALNAPQQLDLLAARLTCLALHFDDGNDLDQKMRDLSGLFKTVLGAAKGMQAIHVGFPAHRPLNLPFDALFHNITFERLVAFGVQGWNLHTEEILRFVLRHRDRLKGLRLRDVRLKEGSWWKDVLSTLRSSMLALEWVSLRRIDYLRHFEDTWVGVEVPDDPPPTQSDSESESESDGGDRAGQRDISALGEDSGADSGDDIDSTDEYEARANEMDFPALGSPTTLAGGPSWDDSTFRDVLISAEDIGDDGYAVSNSKRKMWEKWVIRKDLQYDT